MNAVSIPSPTDGIDTISLAAQLSRLLGSALRWSAACVVAMAALLVLAIALASMDRTAAGPQAQPSASAFLDFDLAVLRELGGRSLAAVSPDDALRRLWAQRPAWRLPPAPDGGRQLVSLRDAWSASVADRSRFRSAARGVGDALWLLFAGLGIALVTAALAGALQERIRFGRPSAPGRATLALTAATALTVVFPLLPLLDAALFYDRTRSLGGGPFAAFFVAAFAGAMPGAAARALFAPPRQVEHLGALRGRPVVLSAARLCAIDATRWLVPLVPALAAAAVFACAKADQDPALGGGTSGLGALIRAATQEVSAADRLSSAALAAGALVVLWYLGHRFVVEIRSALSAAGSAR